MFSTGLICGLYGGKGNSRIPMHLEFTPLGVFFSSCAAFQHNSTEQPLTSAISGIFEQSRLASTYSTPEFFILLYHRFVLFATWYKPIKV